MTYLTYDLSNIGQVNSALRLYNMDENMTNLRTHFKILESTLIDIFFSDGGKRGFCTIFLFITYCEILAYLILELGLHIYLVII